MESKGILNKGHYGDMLKGLIEFFDHNAHIYYFDLSFDETVNRHNTREKRLEFDADVLRDWWNPNDVLGVDGEYLITNNMSQQDAVQFIINHQSSLGKPLFQNKGKRRMQDE